MLFLLENYIQWGYEIMGILKTREGEHGREIKRRELK